MSSSLNLKEKIEHRVSAEEMKRQEAA